MAATRRPFTLRASATRRTACFADVSSAETSNTAAPAGSSSARCCHSLLQGRRDADTRVISSSRTRFNVGLRHGRIPHSGHARAADQQRAMIECRQDPGSSGVYAPGGASRRMCRSYLRRFAPCSLFPHRDALSPSPARAILRSGNRWDSRPPVYLALVPPDGGRVRRSRAARGSVLRYECATHDRRASPDGVAKAEEGE